MGLVAHGSELAKVEYSIDNGVSWRILPGCSSYSETGGEAPERDVIAFEGATKLTGTPRVPSVDISAVIAPLHPSWRQMRAFMLDKSSALFRLVTKSRTAWAALAGAGNTAAVAIAGAVTFAKAQGGKVPNLVDARYGPGQVLTIGAKTFVIDTISGSPPAMVVQAYAAGVVAPVAAATVAAVGYTISVPALKREFEALVRLTSRGSLESESQLTSPLNLAPLAELPDWSIAA